MALRLPPLNALRLFEAAARRLSFKQAAEELHVTPSAVSHGIQALEDWLGTELFQRGSRGLSLTVAGQAYYPAVRDALQGIVDATDKLPGRKATGSLSVSVAPTFGAKWLVPRLARFRERFPDVSVIIDTAHRQIEFPIDQIDLAIRLAHKPRGTATWFPLLQETFVPVWAPCLKEKLNGKSLVELLAAAPIIHVMTVTEEWDAWLKTAGIERDPRKDDLRFDTIQMATEAAVQGLGIALGRKPLVNAELESSALEPVADIECAAENSYWLVGAAVTFERPEVKVFKNWILEEVQLLQQKTGLVDC